MRSTLGFSLVLALLLPLTLVQPASAQIVSQGVGGRIVFTSGFGGTLFTSATNQGFPAGFGAGTGLFLVGFHVTPAGSAVGGTAINVGVGANGFPQALVPINSFLRQLRAVCAPGEPAQLHIHFDAVFTMGPLGFPAHDQFLWYPVLINNPPGLGSFGQFVGRMTYGARPFAGAAITHFGMATISAGSNQPGFFFAQPTARFRVPAIPSGWQFLMWGDVWFTTRGCPPFGLPLIALGVESRPLEALPAPPQEAISNLAAASSGVPDVGIEDPENVFMEMGPMPEFAFDENGEIHAEQIDGDGVPVLQPPGDWVAREGEMFFAPLFADDPEGDPLEIVPDADAPPGVTIDPAGNLTWVPAAAGMFRFHVLAREIAAPDVFDEDVITVAVEGLNHAPRIDEIGGTQIAEEQPWVWDLNGFDPDPGDTLSYTLESPAPPGLALSPTGVLSWIPTEEQGPGVYLLTVRATDDGSPNLWSEQSLYLTVVEVNQPPDLAPVPPQSPVPVDELLRIQLSASDPDSSGAMGSEDPASDPLSYSLVSGPAGASVDTQTGELTWTPMAGQEGFHFFQVRVQDLAGAFDEESFQVEVPGGGGGPSSEPIPTPEPTGSSLEARRLGVP